MRTGEEDVQKVINSLTILGRNIENDSKNKVKEVGELGFNYAFNLAPEDEGNLKNAMRLEFPEEYSAVIISDVAPEDYGFPVNIVFDTNQFGNMTMYGPKGTRVKFKPYRQSSIGFMIKTAEFLKREFAERLKLSINHNIEKVGNKGR